jgi:hypothetical protein
MNFVIITSKPKTQNISFKNIHDKSSFIQIQILKYLNFLP